MAYPLLQFVDDAASTATLRYDFNTKNSSYKTHPLGGDGLDLGTPSFTGDPDAAGAEYGERQMRFVQRVEGTKTQAMSRMTVLARELLRAQNWLRFQMDATSPVFYFKTYRTEPGALSLEHVETAGAWDIQVPLIADGFAYGARETMSLITVNNDPAHASNPCRVVLPTVLGDAPAPLRFYVHPSASDLAGFRHMFAVHCTTDAVAGPIAWQVGGVDGWTAGADTAASSADANSSGGTRRLVSFATTPGMATRLSGLVPAALPNGRYKALVRVARSDTSSTFGLRFGRMIAGSYRYLDTVAMDRAASTAVGHATWVDLGDFQHPFGHDAPKGQWEGFAYIPDMALQAERRSGTGSLSLDAFLVIPLDSTVTIQNRILFSEQNLAGITNVGFWDGDVESAWGLTTFGIAQEAFVAEMQGQFPQVVPGAVNTLHFLQQVNARKPQTGVDTSDVITASTELTLSYHPRYLYLGSG